MMCAEGKKPHVVNRSIVRLTFACDTRIYTKAKVTGADRTITLNVTKKGDRHLGSIRDAKLLSSGLCRKVIATLFSIAVSLIFSKIYFRLKD